MVADTAAAGSEDGDGRPRVQGVRRRPALLRGGGRVHPPPRPQSMAAAGDAVGRGRRQEAPSRRRPGQPVHPEPDVRSGGEAGCARQLLPRPRAGASDIREAFGELEPISPCYRDRVARLEALDAQGVEALLPVPDARRGHGGRARARRAPRWPRVPRVQPLARRRLGRQLRGTASSRRPTSRSPMSTGRSRSSSGRSRTTPASSTCAPRRCIAADGAPLARPPAARPVLAARSTTPASRVRIHSGDAGYGFMLDYWGQDSEFEAFRVRHRCGRSHDVAHQRRRRLVHRRGHLRTGSRNIRLATIESGCGVGRPAAQEDEEGLRAAQARLRGGSDRDVPHSCLCLALLRGRPARARAT